jgi:C-terminal processing protease CtpA/Prc
MRVGRLFFYLFAAGLFVATGCSEGREEITQGDPAPELGDSEKINKFTVDCTQELYLWESLTDWEKYDNYDTYRSYPDHYKLFDVFKYSEDRWSELTNDIDSWQSSLQGISTTYGYVLIRGKFSNTETYFAIILFVYPGTPAEKAGLKRGDIIAGMNGGDITGSNYTDLYYSSSITLQLGVFDAENNSIDHKPGSVSMDAVEMYENPINTVRIIEKNEHKIGYLCYTDYINTSERELQNVFAGFKAAGVTDVVLDLRYNGGGHATTAKILSSILAPRTATKNKDVYLTQKWNDLYEQYWKSQDIDNNERFVDTLSVNMDLSRLYVLTTRNTASASEATIIGLKPYLDVVLVGDTTHGKYYGGYLLSVDDYYEGSKGYNKEYYLNISNWGMYVMVYRYANKNGYPDFSGGLAPDRDLLAAEDYVDLKPFGDETDPLLGKALAKITGERYVEKRSLASRPLPSYTVFPEMRSRSSIKGKLVQTGPLPALN